MSDAQLDPLVAHCKSKPGAREDSWEESISFKVLSGSLDGFFDYRPRLGIVVIRCRDATIAEQSKLRPSKHMCWDTEGWQWVEFSLGEIDSEIAKDLIDESYQLVLESEQFCDRDYGDNHEILRQIGKKLEARDCIRELCAHAGIAHRFDEIDKRSKTAIRLQRAEREASVGSSRLGGRPDLPVDMNWPTHPSGRPLSFLAQFDLSEIKLPHPFAQHRAGHLWLFSAWGWRVEDDSDPDIPWEEADDQVGWNRLLHSGGPLRSQVAAPDGAQPEDSYKSIEVNAAQVLTLLPPEDLGGSEVDRETYQWQVYFPFLEIQKHIVGACPRHILCGHPNYVQTKSEVGFEDPVLFFQLASDDDMESCFGDGGYLYFFASETEVAKGDLRVLADYQCG